jgi:hypothetical protein
MAGAGVHPARAGRQVADPVRDGLAQLQLAGVAVLPDPLIEAAELRIPARDLAALDGLGAALQAETLLPQQVRHRVRAGAVTPPGQLARQDTQRPDRPPQRRHRIPALIGPHQRQQRRPQPPIQASQPLAAPAGLAGTPDTRPGSPDSGHRRPKTARDFVPAKRTSSAGFAATRPPSPLPG